MRRSTSISAKRSLNLSPASGLSFTLNIISGKPKRIEPRSPAPPDRDRPGDDGRFAVGHPKTPAPSVAAYHELARARSGVRFASLLGIVVPSGLGRGWPPRRSPRENRPVRKNVHNGTRRAADNAAVPVPAAVATTADVPVYFDGVGSSRALNTVTVKAQVDGKLMSVNFKEGQDVDQDFVLAEIDATIYQAQYDQAVAKKAMDEAQLANARLDLERYARLMQTNSATRQQHDTQRALVAQLEAQVQADQGAIENSKAILSYTRIIAPLAGRTGIRQVDAGNIVHAADTTGIVVITQVRPIAVIFTLPQQRLAQVNKAFTQEALSVQALGDDNRTVVDRGTLTVIDNQVDQTTGTVKLKAEFPNKDLQIWPGQFVNGNLPGD